MSAASATARIGPNAITRMAEALQAATGAAATAAVFHRAGLSPYLQRAPDHMVPEGEVIRLHHEVRAALPARTAREVARDAGARTAAYLLAHRIPRVLQRLLPLLPPRWAARVLLGAISRHAWTFAGSGAFSWRAGPPGGAALVWLELRGNPLCRGLREAEPACDYYAATFQALFRALVHPRVQVRETACEARGDAQCRFEVRA